MFVKIKTFWLKPATMNFRRFPSALREDAVGTIWTKFQLSSIFFLSEANFTSLLNEVSGNSTCMFAL